MENYPIEQGYALVISEELAKVGYEELMVGRKEGFERYVKIPLELHSLEITLPPSISRLEGIPNQESQYTRIPFDSIPIKILDLERSKNLQAKYTGKVSDLQSSIDILTTTNPNLVTFLTAHELQIEDLLIVSIKESQINILL